MASQKFKIPETVPVTTRMELQPLSRVPFLQFQVLNHRHGGTWAEHATLKLRYSLRYFQACSATEALRVYCHVCSEAEQHEVSHPEYCEVRDYLEAYLVDRLTHGWATHPLPVKKGTK